MQSVLGQTYGNIEYIVVDGKSTDGTVEVILEYAARIPVRISEPDSGIYDAMNKGIASATGDYLFFLNSGDRFLHERVVEKVVGDISPSLPDLVYGDMVFFNPADGTAWLKKQNHFNKVYVYKNTPCQPTVFYKRSVFDLCGNFRTDYKIIGDFDWMLNAILRRHVSLQYVGKMITLFAFDGISSQRNTGIHDLERAKVYAEYFPGAEGVAYSFVSRYFRSLTRVPIVSDLLNLVLRFRLDNPVRHG